MGKVVISYNPAPELVIFQTGDSLSMPKIWIKKNTAFCQIVSDLNFEMPDIIPVYTSKIYSLHPLLLVVIQAA